MATAGTLNFLVGLWLIVSPFALGYDRGDPFGNPIVFGALVALLGLFRATGTGRATWLSWANVVAGIWLFVSGFWLADFPLARLNLWVFGLGVFMLALVSIEASETGVGSATTHGS
jgi:hypothetical protein